MAGLLGTVGPFERDADDWTAYCELALVAATVVRKRAIMLSVYVVLPLIS